MIGPVCMQGMWAAELSVPLVLLIKMWTHF